MVFIHVYCKPEDGRLKFQTKPNTLLTIKPKNLSYPFHPNFFFNKTNYLQPGCSFLEVNKCSGQVVSSAEFSLCAVSVSEL